MTPPISIGFPRMTNEVGEKRVFLPEFIQYLAALGMTVYIEEGYGARTGYSYTDFMRAGLNIQICSHAETFQKDVCIILRSPRPQEFDLVSPGTTLVSMLHYPTRSNRIALLGERDIKAISLDSIVNNSGIRLVENMKAVAWNGLEAAFDWLELQWSGLVRADGNPIQVLILGAGMVGKHAVEAATKLGNVERNSDHIAENGPGAVALTVGRNLTSNPVMMEGLLQRCDILVDATQRRDTSVPVVPNEWIAWLPEHAVIVDLAVDPYKLDAKPPVVRGVEGTPQGNLDQYVFPADDPTWDKLVPESIPSEHRRTAVTCYSWPGVHPEACMRHYGQQLEPLMYHLVKKGYDGLSINGDYFERALYRATLKAWLQDEADKLGSKPKGSE